MFEIGAPSCLPLGMVKFAEPDQDRSALLGIALQHPPVHLEAKKSQRFAITGPRADVGHAYALRYLQNMGLPQQGEIEIELAVPAYMGLSSGTLQGLSVAAGFAYIHGNDPTDLPAIAQQLELEDGEGLALWAAAEGGLLLVDSQPDVGGLPPLHRRAVPDQSQKNAWAFVLVLPRVSSDEYAMSLETDRMAALLQSKAELDGASGRLLDEVLWPAVEQDNLDKFGAGLMELQAMNRAALETTQPDVVPQLSAKDEEILAVMAESGAVAWGQSPTGLGLYALMRGAQATVDLRKTLQPMMGYTSGHTLATITHGDGLRAVERRLGF